MLQNVKFEKILFLDIETIPQYPDFNSLPSSIQELWEEKSKYFRSETQTLSDVYDRAGIYAEFGRIICISVGMLFKEKNEMHIRIKSFYHDDEKILLTEFIDLLNTSFNKPDNLLCAHNGKEFDFPYISRRILINSLKLPAILDISGKKPWEVKHLDTLDLWKFGDYKHYTSLKLLTSIFNIDSPKSDIEGSDVAKVYWQEKNLLRIVNYCQRDVLAVAQIMLKFKGMETVKPDNVEIVLK